MSKFDDRRKQLGLGTNNESAFERRRRELNMGQPTQKQEAQRSSDVVREARNKQSKITSEARKTSETRKPVKVKTLNEIVYGGTDKFLAPENKQNIKESVKKYETLDSAKKRLLSKGPVGEALVERPSYGQRVKDTIGGLPKVLRPIAAPVVALSQAPFMVATREALGTDDPKREGFQPVSGGGKIAGQILAPLHHLAGAQGAGLAGGQLYTEAGNLLAKYAPNIVNTVGGRIAGKVIQGVSEGIPTNVGATLAANPQATPQELKESALYGGAFGLIPGAGKLVSEGVQAGARKALSPYVKGLQERIRAGNVLREVAEGTPITKPSAPIAEASTPPLENPKELAKWVKKEAGFDDVSLNEMRKLDYEDLRQLADDIVQSRAPKAAETPIQATEPVPVAPVQTAPVAPTSARPRYTIERTENIVTPPKRGQPRTIGQRSFANTLQSSGRISPETAEALKQSDKLKYEVITNAETLARANRAIERKGIDAAESELLGKKKYQAEDVAKGIRLIDELQKSGNTQRAVTVAENLSKALTEAGQAVQAASIVNRLTPEGAFIYATKRVREAGGTLKSGDADSITGLATVIQKSGTSSERATTVMDIATKLKNKEKLTTDELKELTTFVDDAQSMLGKPKAVKAEKPPRLPSEKKVREQLLASLTEKEVALQEFIRKNSRRVSSTPLDLWGAYAALGAIKMAKGAISFSKWSEQMIKDAGESIRPHLSNLFDRSQQEAKQLQHLLPDKTAAEKIAQKYIDADRLTDKDAQLIHDLASRIGKMNTNDKMAASREMQSILNKYEKGSWADRLNALRYIDMLGNTHTQLVNAVSSPLMMLERYMLDMAQTPFDIARSKITGGPRTVTFKQGPKVWDNFFTPVGDYIKGAGVGGKSGWEGIDPSGITSQTDIRGLAFKSKWNPARWAEGSLGAVMKGADYASYNTAVQTKLRQMAYLDALNKGVKGTDNIRNYMDRYLNNLDSNIVDVADRFGKEMTFQQRSRASQGAQAAVRGINKFSTLGLTEKTGLGSALLPFVKTPTNLIIAGLERTPLGFLKGIYQLKTMAKNPEITPNEIAATFSKAIWGSAGLTGTGYILGKLGILTGDSASTDKNVQALEADVGKGKFKFNTSAFGRMMNALVTGNVDDVKDVSKFRRGDKQLNYNKLQPFAFSIAAGATFAEQQRQSETATQRGGQISVGQQIGSAVAASGQSIYEMSLLKGLQDAFDVQPGQKAAGIATEIGQNYLKSFSPSLFAQEARRQDDTQRQVTYKGLTEPVTQYFQSRFPGQSQKLPPKVSTMGDTRKNERGVIANYLNPLQSATTQYNEASQIIYDLIQKTGDEGLAPKPIDKNLSGKKNGKKIEVSLNPSQAAKLQQETGKEISSRVLSMPKGLSPEESASLIEDIYADSRKLARDKFKKELGWD